MSFLKAEWRKLAIANYEIDPSVLSEFIPHGTEIDMWNGRCYVSLVGFMFLNTRLLGCKIPFHVNFPEVNLRFYVKRFENKVWKRGVVFIKEIVPKHALTFVANTIYKENYQTLPMKYKWEVTTHDRQVTYSWKCGSYWHTFQINAAVDKTQIKPESETEFITEHYWGYAKVNEFKTNEYEVTHPKWYAYKVDSYRIEVDFGKVYGSKFNFLNTENPVSVMLAEGSEISVENKKCIKRVTTEV